MKCARLLILTGMMLLCAWIPVRADANGSPAQSQITALNMAVLSVRHITAARDRLVLDQEYSQVVNNLSLGDLGDAPEVMAVYARLLDTISACRLSEEERQVFAGIYDHRQKNALKTVLAGLRPSSRSLKSFFASLFSCGVSAYFGVRRELAEIHRAAGAKSWELQKEQLAALHQLQRELLEATWQLLRRHGLPESFRITQDDLDGLERAVAESDWSRAAPMFALLEKTFAEFPPYWFYRADAAYRAGDTAFARDYLDEYERLWTRVLRRDPCRARAARIRLMLDENLSDADTLVLLQRILDETASRDWLDRLFCGTMLWAMGDREEAMTVVSGNVLFGAEKNVSSVVLEHMRSGDFDQDAFCAALRQALAGDAVLPEENALLSAWLDGADGLALKQAEEEYARENTALSACVLWLTASEPQNGSLARAKEWKSAFDAAAPLSPLPENTVSVLELRAREGNARAALLRAVAAESAWSGEKDPFAAAKWYKTAAELGSVPAQERFAALCMGGTGTQKNPAEGVRWYQAAAAKESAVAHYELGRLYRTGQGVARDLGTAAEHFFAAAQKGHAPAQAALGELYSKGAGVPQDWFEAYKWSTAALLGGAENARKTLNIIDGRGALRKRRLAPERRDEAREAGRRIWESTR